jgi:hypothetical protein
MKKIIISFILALFSSTILIAQPVISSEQLNPNAPQLSFVKVEHDFGTIEQHSEAIAVFEFTNTGKQPLILTDVRTSCGCTVPDWPKNPILPGKKATITVKYDSKNLGVILRQITVISNASVPSVTLTIKGLVKEKKTS